MQCPQITQITRIQKGKRQPTAKRFQSLNVSRFIVIFMSV